LQWTCVFVKSYKISTPKTVPTHVRPPPRASASPIPRPLLALPSGPTITLLTPLASPLRYATGPTLPLGTIALLLRLPTPATLPCRRHLARPHLRKHRRRPSDREEQATTSGMPSRSPFTSCRPCSVAEACPHEHRSLRLSSVRRPESGHLCPSVPLVSRPSPNLRSPAGAATAAASLPKTLIYPPTDGTTDAVVTRHIRTDLITSAPFLSPYARRWAVRS
jgi:hypothetical protein